MRGALFFVDSRPSIGGLSLSRFRDAHRRRPLLALSLPSTRSGGGVFSAYVILRDMWKAFAQMCPLSLFFPLPLTAQAMEANLATTKAALTATAECQSGWAFLSQVRGG